MEQGFCNFLRKQKYSEYTISSYVYWVKRVLEREGLTDWYCLAAKIDMIYVKYELGGEEAEFGDKGKRSCINGLKKFKEYYNRFPSDVRAVIDDKFKSL